MTTPVSRIEILLLAAGGSSRLGRPKQLLPYKGTSLLRYLAQHALRSKARHVRIVVGAHQDIVETEVAGLGTTIVPNGHWSDGLSTSIHAGVRSLPENTDGLIIMLSDMPRVTTEHLNALIDGQQQRGTGIVASRYRGAPGVPALFMRRYFPELLNLHGDRGAKTLLNERSEDIESVDLAGGEVDIDTDQDVLTHLHDHAHE